MKDFGVTAIACTPSYLLHIAETLEHDGDLDKIKLKTAICGAEPWTEQMRHQMEEKLHIHAHDIYGLSEIMGPGVACDCEYHKGLHIQEDHFFPEIISAKTLEPVAAGDRRTGIYHVDEGRTAAHPLSYEGSDEYYL